MPTICRTLQKVPYVKEHSRDRGENESYFTWMLGCGGSNVGGIMVVCNIHQSNI